MFIAKTNLQGINVDKLISALERIACALETIAGNSKNAFATPASFSPVSAVAPFQVREALEETHSGEWLSTGQIAELLNLGGTSARVIGSLAMAAGCQRKRGAYGMVYCIGVPKASPPRKGKNAILPPDIDDVLDKVRAAGHQRTPLQILGMGYGSDRNYSLAMVDLLRERIKNEPFYAPGS